MLTYDMTARGELALYEHLYRCIRKDVEQGAIIPNERLPSKRRLAEHLGVSVVTVEGAYRQLVAEGYVRAVEKRGYYVNEIPQADARARSMSPRVEGLPASDERLASNPDAHMPDPAHVDLVNGIPPEGMLPLGAWASCVRATLAQASARVLVDESYSQGSLRLRRAIVTHLERFRGIRTSPERIVVGAGAQVLYQLIVQLIGRQAVYAIEDPGYTRLARIYEANGVRVEHVGMDGQGMSVHDLARGSADVAHVMPSHQFPTGCVMSVGRRYELMGWASAQQGRYVIEDDYDSEFRLSGRPIPALASMDLDSHVIYVNTFAKTLGPALRVGYMVLPPALSKEYAHRLGFYACTVSAIDQFALARFMETGAYERHVNRARTQYRKLRDGLVTGLRSSSLAGRLSFHEVDSGIHFVLGVETDMHPAELCERLLARGVRICAIDDFRMGMASSSGGDGRVELLVNYAGLADGQVAGVVKAFEEAL